ncbi:MAG: beta-ketoacyl-[acyl-carrier-protein] synthase II, partial [Planctomycetes bacterium]|nr:beta-ketoacyl-[acyl-carrier-protein] synthase II [Planctomycetota bacterium]
MADRRVVITGLGAVTPLGSSVGVYWDGLISGRSGIATVQRHNLEGYDVTFGGECLDFDPMEYIEHRVSKRMDRVTQLAIAASKMAVAEAKLDGRYEPTRSGVILGTGIGGLREIEEQYLRLLERGPRKVSAFTIPKLMANAGAGAISIEFGFLGLNESISTACASAGNAMGEGYHAIRRGQLDVVITGGSEAAVTPLGIAAFAAMKALSTRNDDPAHASRPFDKDRDGFVLSEGAGILVLEDYEHARARGAPIICEMIGFGATADAGDMVQPDPSGAGAARAMTTALAAARLNPEDIDYVN